MSKKTYIAGGCFWGMEELFRKQEGVVGIKAGYTGGEKKNPTYQNHSGHAEAIEVEYDPSQTSFEHILDYFFRIHDPTTMNQQGNDRGLAYRSAIFFQDESEKIQAQKFIEKVNTSGRFENPVVTTLEEFSTFYLAEESHQDYLQKNPGGYTCHVERFGKY